MAKKLSDRLLKETEETKVSAKAPEETLGETTESLTIKVARLEEELRLLKEKFVFHTGINP